MCVCVCKYLCRSVSVCVCGSSSLDAIIKGGGRCAGRHHLISLYRTVQRLKAWRRLAGEGMCSVRCCVVLTALGWMSFQSSYCLAGATITPGQSIILIFCLISSPNPRHSNSII